eukprot:scaffold4647_cov393-Prasinococcus_capsulatus_cf.AAC.5
MDKRFLHHKYAAAALLIGPTCLEHLFTGPTSHKDTLRTAEAVLPSTTTFPSIVTPTLFSGHFGKYKNSMVPTA